jgi:hypothetical protein
MRTTSACSKNLRFVPFPLVEERRPQALEDGCGQPLLESVQVVTEQPRLLRVRDEGALDQHGGPPRLPKHLEPAGHILPLAPVEDDLHASVPKTQSDEFLLDRPGHAMPGTLTAALIGLREAPDLRAMGLRISCGVAVDGDQVGIPRVGEVGPLPERDRPVSLPRERRLELRMGVEDRLEDVRDPQGYIRLAQARGRVDCARVLAAMSATSVP